MKVTNEMVRAARKAWGDHCATSATTLDDMMRAALEAALSHAAGQDGERCSAASGEPDAWLYEYEHDGESDHCLSRVRFIPSWVEARRATEHPLYLRALSRVVPEGNAVIPWRDEIDRMYVEGWAQSLRRIKDYRAYFIEHGYHPEYVAVRLERLLAAIAAQRAEGRMGEVVGEVIVYDSYRAAKLYDAENCFLPEGTKLYAKVSDLIRDDELPGMWERADLIGGAADSMPSPADSPATLGEDVADEHAVFVEHCADKLEKHGYPSTARALRETAGFLRALAKKPEGRAVDFVAENHHDYWVIQVLCADRPRYYSIRKSDAQLLELPHKDSPFVQVNWRDAITTPPEVGGA